jgi:hypothetical protein
MRSDPARVSMNKPPPVPVVVLQEFCSLKAWLPTNVEELDDSLGIRDMYIAPPWEAELFVNSHWKADHVDEGETNNAPPNPLATLLAKITFWRTIVDWSPRCIAPPFLAALLEVKELFEIEMLEFVPNVTHPPLPWDPAPLQVRLSNETWFEAPNRIVEVERPALLLIMRLLKVTDTLESVLRKVVNRSTLAETLFAEKADPYDVYIVAEPELSANVHPPAKLTFEFPKIMIDPIPSE